MGSNMGRRLKDCGYKVTAVYDARGKVAKEVGQELGAEPCKSLARVTELADVIITVVTDDAAMDKIFAPKGSSLLKNADGKIFINCATVHPDTHIEVEKRANKAGAAALEACMASSITQAREGSLYLMIGGEEAIYKKAEPLLKKLSGSMRYIGSAGQAAKVKALVNMVMNINTAGLAEGLGLGEALGIDLAILREVFSQTGANSRVLQTDGEDMQNRDHAPKGSSLLKNADGKIFINCATVHPDTHIEVEKRANKAGAAALEACMASSITQAREGSLYLMIGGEEAIYKKAEPLLKKLSGSMRYIGSAGQAAKVKALVNMVMNINTAGLAEGLGLGEALGIDLAILREVFSQTGANSRVLQTDGEDMQNRDHSCFFSASHAAKDSGIALALGKREKLNLPLAAATKKQYDRMVAEGLGELDKSGIAELSFKGRLKTKKKK